MNAQKPVVVAMCDCTEKGQRGWLARVVLVDGAASIQVRASATERTKSGSHYTQSKGRAGEPMPLSALRSSEFSTLGISARCNHGRDFHLDLAELVRRFDRHDAVMIARRTHVRSSPLPFRQ